MLSRPNLALDVAKVIALGFSSLRRWLNSRATVGSDLPHSNRRRNPSPCNFAYTRYHMPDSSDDCNRRKARYAKQVRAALDLHGSGQVYVLLALVFFVMMT